jgi:hypothetical protein
MDTILLRGRVFELTVIGDTINDELSLECWDLFPGGGLVFTLVKDAGGTMMLRPAGPAIPLDLLEQVAAIAGTELTEQ